MSSTRKKLEEIQSSQSYDQLIEFTDSKNLTQLPKDELELLARLLILQGSQQLAKGDPAVLETFEIAAKITSYSPETLYQQGLIFADYADNIRCLLFAHTAFNQAHQQNPDFLEACYEDGKMLLGIGTFDGDIHYFIEAKQCFEKAAALLGNHTAKINLGDFYWKWGQCLAVLGRLAGEPLDFHHALDKFNLAHKHGLSSATFFNEYGDALSDLGNLLDKKDYFVEALKFFNRAVKLEPEGFHGWFNQACCLQRLCESGVHEQLLEQSDRSFTKSSQLDPSHSLVWMKWGQLEILYGKFKQDLKKVTNSLEKFEKANQLDPNQPTLLYFWAETELYLGSQEERLDLILSAKSKILKSLEIQPELPDTWYLYGICLNELGHYFEEENYFSEAIEKFQYGLSLNSRNPLLWYGMALSHYALGEIKNQQALIEKAVRFCSRVIDCGGGSVPQFWNDWGVALLKLAEMTEQIQYVEWAIEKFERAIKSSAISHEKDSLNLEWVYHCGCAYDLLGDLTGEHQHFEKAVSILSQVVQLDPQDSHARYNYALALFHLGDANWDVEAYHKSIEQYQILIEEDPEEANVHIDYAISLINLALLIEDQHQPERTQELYHLAESHLVQGASLGNFQACYHLAGLYSINGLYPQAMHFIEKSQFFGVLPSVVDLIHDEWLEGLRQTTFFREFLDGLSSQSKDEK